MMCRHFLSLLDFPSEDLQQLIEKAMDLKSGLRQGQLSSVMKGKTLAMVFEKASTRTRVSFEIGANQLGGSALFLSPGDSQMSRGESLADTARVLSSMADLIVMRTLAHERLTEVAQHSQVPVINAMSDTSHPCQLLADILTFVEHRGSIANATVAWIGDGNNVCQSWINAARQFGFNLRVATPIGYEPDSDIVAASKDYATLSDQPEDAVLGADLVVTDTWTSIAMESERADRESIFSNYRVTSELMHQASKDALFMHCLPAYRGREVDAKVIDGPQSGVWDEAENRLHAQKALMFMLLAG